MSCDLESELTAYLDGELSPQRTTAVRAHLAGCAACRSTEALLRSAVVTLDGLPAFEPSVGLRRAVMQRLDTAPSALGERLRRWLRPSVFLPSAAVLVSAGVVAVLLASGSLGHRLPAELRDAQALDVAMNYDVLRDYDVLGVDNPDDVEVVAQLDRLEARP